MVWFIRFSTIQSTVLPFILITGHFSRQIPIHEEILLFITTQIDRKFVSETSNSILNYFKTNQFQFQRIESYADE